MRFPVKLKDPVKRFNTSLKPKKSRETKMCHFLMAFSLTNFQLFELKRAVFSSEEVLSAIIKLRQELPRGVLMKLFKSLSIALILSATSLYASEVKVHIPLSPAGSFDAKAKIHNQITHIARATELTWS